jgi:hypothetical protein
MRVAPCNWFHGRCRSTRRAEALARGWVAAGTAIAKKTMNYDMLRTETPMSANRAVPPSPLGMAQTPPGSDTAVAGCALRNLVLIPN